MRGVLMRVEGWMNMGALVVRFAFSKPDILHIQWIPMVRKLPFEVWFLILVKKLGIKLVYTVHNVLPHDTGKSVVLAFRRVYKEMDELICHTHQPTHRLIRQFHIHP